MESSAKGTDGLKFPLPLLISFALQSKGEALSTNVPNKRAGADDQGGRPMPRCDLPFRSPPDQVFASVVVRLGTGLAHYSRKLTHQSETLAGG
jgi:hypothetical protein